MLVIVAMFRPRLWCMPAKRTWRHGSMCLWISSHSALVMAYAMEAWKHVFAGSPCTDLAAASHGACRRSGPMPLTGRSSPRLAPMAPVVSPARLNQRKHVVRSPERNSRRRRVCLQAKGRRRPLPCGMCLHNSNNSNVNMQKYPLIIKITQRTS